MVKENRLFIEIGMTVSTWHTIRLRKENRLFIRRPTMGMTSGTSQTILYRCIVSTVEVFIPRRQHDPAILKEDIAHSETLEKYLPSNPI